jgi:hypothetical protein
VQTKPRASHGGPAVYGEYSLSGKPTVAGWNTRVFDKREVEEGKNISLDDQPGVVTLKPGRYHITAMSLVNYADPANATIIPIVLAPPGRLCAPSLFQGRPAAGYRPDRRCHRHQQLVVEHQVGEDVKGLYLQVNENNSVWHINARITIQRI